MTTQTVHTLKYQLLVDSSGLEQGLNRSKREINAAKRVMREVATPLEKYQAGVSKLDNLLKKGLLNKELYTRKVKQLGDKYHQATQKQTMFTRGMDRLKGTVLATITAYIGLSTVRGLTSFYSQQVDEMDSLAKASKRIGISIEQLTKIQQHAGLTAGIEADRVTKGLEKMVRRVAEVSIGTGEAKKALELLDLANEAFFSASPDQQYLMIGEAMRMITNENDRLLLATKLFDDEQAAIHLSLMKVNQALLDQNDLLGLDGGMAARAEQAKDAMTELGTAWKGLKMQMANLVHGPALTNMAMFIEMMKTPGDVLTHGPQHFVWRYFFNKGMQDYKKKPLETTLRKEQSDIAKQLEEHDAMLEQKDNKEKERAKRQEKLKQEALALTQAIKTAEEKRADAIAKANQLYKENLLTQEKYERALKHADDELKRSLFARLNASQTIEKQKVTRNVLNTIDPAAGIQPGTSEEFRILNRTVVSSQVELEVEQQQLDIAKLSLDELRLMNAKQTGTEVPSNTGLE